MLDIKLQSTKIGDTVKNIKSIILSITIQKKIKILK